MIKYVGYIVCIKMWNYPMQLTITSEATSLVLLTVSLKVTTSPETH